MSYEPQPGTIPYRAIELFKDLPAGTILSTAELAEKLDIATSGIAACLALAREHGALKGEMRIGERVMRWSQGDGVAVQREQDEPLSPRMDERSTRSAALVDKLTDLPQVRKPAKKTRPAALVPEQPTAPTPPEDVPEAPPAFAEPQQRVKLDDLKPWGIWHAPEPAKWGVFSDGSFQIQQNGQFIVLPAVEFESLLSFLNRTCKVDGE